MEIRKSGTEGMKEKNHFSRSRNGCEATAGNAIAEVACFFLNMGLLICKNCRESGRNSQV
jgi:hypothetical protein